MKPRSFLLLGKHDPVWRIVLGEAVSQFLEHHHIERNHLGLENRIISPEFAEFPAEGAVYPRKRLGGLLNYYCRKAAMRIASFEFADATRSPLLVPGLPSPEHPESTSLPTGKGFGLEHDQKVPPIASNSHE